MIWDPSSGRSGALLHKDGLHFQFGYGIQAFLWVIDCFRWWGWLIYFIFGMSKGEVETYSIWQEMLYFLTSKFEDDSRLAVLDSIEVHLHEVTLDSGNNSSKYYSLEFQELVCKLGMWVKQLWSEWRNIGMLVPFSDLHGTQGLVCELSRMSFPLND